MSVKVNLIPDKFKKQGSLYKVFKVFNVISIVGTVVFFVSFLVMTFVIILNDNKIKGLTVKQDQFKKQLSTLADKETKYSFLKSKSGQIKNVNQVKEAQYQPLYEMLIEQGDKIQVPEVSINAEKIDFMMYTGSIKNLMAFFDELIKKDIYKDVSVSDLSYSQDGGFYTEVKFSY